MNPSDAAFHLVRNYPGGAASLGPRMNKRPDTLLHETDPRRPEKFGLDSAVMATQLTGDPIILNAFAHECGYMTMPLPDAGADAHCVLTAVSGVMHEASDVVRVVSKSIADDVVTDNEISECRREIAEAIRALQQMDMALAAKNRAGKPAHVLEAA